MAILTFITSIMKRLFIRFLLTTIAVVVFSNVMSAQIKYIDGNLLIGNVAAPCPPFDITINSKGIFLFNQTTRYFQIDLLNSGAPKIAGNGGKIAFYDTMTGTFNSIQVSQVLTYSDARAKTNITNFNSGPDVIRRLRPVSYNFTGNQSRSVSSNQYTGNNAEIGLLAQELEEILPNLVYTDEEGKKLVDYVSLIPVLIDAVQDLQREVDMLKSKSSVK